MPEPTTIVGLSAVTAYLAKDGLDKLLGPTAEYLGNGLRDFTKARAENIASIFKLATHKLGSKLNETGTVPPRVLKVIVNEGSFCEDVIQKEYFAGVLASSRTETGTDDRGARVGKKIDNLSKYQIRAHYLIYREIKALFSGKNFIGNNRDRPKLAIYFPFANFRSGLDIEHISGDELGALVDHILFGLHQDGFIEGFQYGQLTDLKNYLSKELFAQVDAENIPGREGGVYLEPSAAGIELFLWAHGCGQWSTAKFLSSATLPRMEMGQIPTGLAFAARA